MPSGTPSVDGETEQSDEETGASAPLVFSPMNTSPIPGPERERAVEP
ncbi:MAG: hypothetical protein ABEJ76_09120 [Halanaeroarchaeum sp.]